MDGIEYSILLIIWNYSRRPKKFSLYYPIPIDIQWLFCSFGKWDSKLKVMAFNVVYIWDNPRNL